MVVLKNKNKYNLVNLHLEEKSRNRLWQEINELLGKNIQKCILFVLWKTIKARNDRNIKENFQKIMKGTKFTYTRTRREI